MDQGLPEHPLIILAQYIKDLSFENPNAPEIYGQLNDAPPEVTVNIDVVPTLISEQTYEVVLAMRIQAMSGDKLAFLIELDYAGIAHVREAVQPAEMERYVLCETPRHFFPFARNILADMTRDAGFPPVVVNPIDFERFYQRHKKGSLSNAGDVDETSSANGEAPASESASSETG